jgi:chromosome segregation ATPase
MEGLERMPLEDVEANLHQLQSDLEKLVSFVNDQEEELNLQSQAVEELMAKLAEANDDQRPSLEEELAEERERKGMLNRTLVGQRNNLSERQNILLIYEQIIKRRKGIEEDAHNNTINLEPILARLAQEQHQQEEEKARIEQEISHLQGSLAQIREGLDPQWQEQEQKTRAMEEMEAQWQQAHLEINQLEAQVQLYDNALPPAQEKLNTIRHHFEGISEWLKPS